MQIAILAMYTETGIGNIFKYRKYVRINRHQWSKHVYKILFVAFIIRQKKKHTY
jgi:uncharacterized membrane protein